MRKLNLTISERNFNLLWRALNDRENVLLNIINCQDALTDDDVVALAKNDLVYLRLYQDELKQQAKQANFSQGVFTITDEFIEI